MKLQSLLEDDIDDMVSDHGAVAHALFPGSWSRNELIDMMMALKGKDSFLFSAYLGKNSSRADVEKAVESIKYTGYIAAGRKSPAGYGFKALIEHTNLQHEKDGPNREYDNGHKAHTLIISPLIGKKGIVWDMQIYDGKRTDPEEFHDMHSDVHDDHDEDEDDDY